MVLCSQLQRESEADPVDLKLKPQNAGWIVSLYDYIKSKPDLVKNGFKEAGIINCGMST